jgi:phosphoribosylaminoimidazole-succinocarboxamide synthase
MTVLLETNLPNLMHRGKVRDTYDLGDGRLLVVATDRISAFDVVLPSAIPDKGAVLTQMSAFWFTLTREVVPNHLIRIADGSEADELPFELPPELYGRSLIVRKAERLDVECVVRGYLAGSGWAEYRDSGRLFGLRIPPDLKESEALPEPMFTPTTKEEEGHDEPISFSDLIQEIGPEAATAVRLRSLALYKYAAQYARQRGIIIADTKFEFGLVDGEPIVIDEMLTPDSSRFWPAAEYEPGRPQHSFDKQFVRDWLNESGWNKQPPAPELPPDIIEKTAERYREAYRRLTGRELMRFEEAGE